jgi:hypothetical protein
MYVYMYLCMYACMNRCVSLIIHGQTGSKCVREDGKCMYACMHACMYVCKNAFMDACADIHTAQSVTCGFLMHVCIRIHMHTSNSLCPVF